VESVARMDSCHHPFCRQCFTEYTRSKIREHRFPILCPTCTTQDDVKNTGLITEQLVEQIGLSQDEYNTFIELEMAAFSTLMHCRKCNRGAFVDKAEYDGTTILTCPFPNCSSMWCKSCQQQVEFGGPDHSCDGSNELGHLMKDRGWKHCPGCRTPTEKDGGCNHMSCIAPGCNTHFCYTCGVLIVQSALRNEISTAVESHYMNGCSLFQVVNP